MSEAELKQLIVMQGNQIRELRQQQEARSMSLLDHNNLQSRSRREKRHKKLLMLTSKELNPALRYAPLSAFASASVLTSAFQTTQKRQGTRNRRHRKVTQSQEVISRKNDETEDVSKI